MNTFQRRWESPSPSLIERRPDKTDETSFVSSVSSHPPHSGGDEGPVLPGHHGDKSDKRPSGSFVSSHTGAFGGSCVPSVGPSNKFGETDEGYFWRSPAGDRVRLKLPTIVNRCRLYAELMARSLTLNLIHYRLPYDQGTRQLLASPFLKCMPTLEVTSAAARLCTIKRELADAIGGDVPADALLTFAAGALAGEYAIAWSILNWDPAYPLLAAFDYLEVRSHARWASATPVPALGGGQ